MQIVTSEARVHQFVEVSRMSLKVMVQEVGGSRGNSSTSLAAVNDCFLQLRRSAFGTLFAFAIDCSRAVYLLLKSFEI